MKKWRISSRTGMDSPFDSEQLLWVSIIILSKIEILENVKVFARRRRRRRQGYYNISTFSSKTAELKIKAKFIFSV